LGSGESVVELGSCFSRGGLYKYVMSSTATTTQVDVVLFTRRYDSKCCRIPQNAMTAFGCGTRSCGLIHLRLLRNPRMAMSSELEPPATYCVALIKKEGGSDSTEETVPLPEMYVVWSKSSTFVSERGCIFRISPSKLIASSP